MTWDKCLGPDTLVWTDRGTQRIVDIEPGDRVALPEGGTTTLRAMRKTRTPALRLQLSDGTDIVASTAHRFMRGDGTIAEARHLKAGDTPCSRNVRDRVGDSLCLDDVIPANEAVFELPSTSACLW